MATSRLLGVRWNLSAADIDAATAGLLAQYRAVVDRVKALAPADAAAALPLLALVEGEVATASVAVTLPGYCSSGVAPSLRARAGD